jgi:hypothetical protein
MSDFMPYSKDAQLKGSRKKENKSKGMRTNTPLRAKKPMNKKRKEPRRTDKTRTNIATGHKKPSLYQRGYFGKDYEKAYEEHGKVCGERIVPTAGVKPCSGGLQMHHVKFKSGGGRGVWRNGRPLCDGHHDLCHESREYADKWREIHAEKYGEDYYKDEWDLYKEGKIVEPTKEHLEAYMGERERKTNWGI